MPDVKVLLGAPPRDVSPDTLRRVEEIWRAEKNRRGGALFNGPMFSIETAESHRIVGRLADYKLFLAQRRDPRLYETLRVRPLAVTGLLFCEGGVIFGCRASHVEQDAGLRELVPSGGIDGSTRKPDGSIDLVKHALIELSEETGIEAASIRGSPKAFCIVNDADSHVSDVGIILQTGLSKQEVMTAFALLKNREHVFMEVIPVRQLTEFIEGHKETFAGTSLAFLEAARQTFGHDFSRLPHNSPSA
jgi:hypothetical protein